MTRREAAAVAVRLFLSVLVLGGLYAALAWWTGQSLPAQVTVDGVEVGGLTREQAQSRLAVGLAGAATGPITVHVGDTARTFVVDPAKAGLSLDVAATLEGLTGFTLDPGRVWDHLTGRVTRPVATVVDRRLLRATVESAAKALDTDPVDGAVRFVGTTVVTTVPRDGLTLDIDDAVDKLAHSYPRASSVAVRATVVPPAVTQSALDAAVLDFAEPVVSAPIVLVVGDRSAVVPTGQYVRAVTMAPDSSGHLTPIFDRSALEALVVRVATALLGPATPDPGGVDPGPSASIIGTIDTATAADRVIAAMTTPDRTAIIPTASSSPPTTAVPSASPSASALPTLPGG
jgi:hypothetical protein